MSAALHWSEIMPASFGARLKAQREHQQVTLEAIAERTKIRVSLLDALEHDDVSRWPSGIFRRSYFRSYAEAIGLDPESAVREFLDLHPDVIEEPEAALEAIAQTDQAGRRPPMRLQYLIASAMNAVPKVFSSKADHAGVFDSPAPTSQPIDGGERVIVGESALVAATVLAAPAAGSQCMATTAGDGQANAVETFSVDADDAAAPERSTPPNEAMQFDLPAMAQLCTRIVEAGSADDLERLLEEAARVLHATGLIVWPWDPSRGVLWPSMSHGYSRRILASLPTVAPDAANPVGAAFRSSACQVVDGTGTATGAIVVPLSMPGGCRGVLAVECTSGLEQEPTLLALATILAAQLSPHVTAEPLTRTAIA